MKYYSIKGGCWEAGPVYCRIITHIRFFPLVRNTGIGFRLVKKHNL